MTHPDFQHRVLPKASILLVDDEPANLLALQAVLEPLDQILVLARSGEEALAKVAEQDFAVVLLDVQMQGIDGFSAAKLIRERDNRVPTPIIFLTAYESNRLSVVEAYKLGAVDYLTKPLVPEILQAKVAGFVELFQRSEIIKQQAGELEANERQQRLQVEAALRDSEDRHRVWVQAVKDFAIFLMDSGGRVASWNEGGERLTGYAMEDAIGKHLRTFFIAEDQAAKKPERELQRATATGSASDENWIVRKDGSRFWASGYTTALRDEAGQLRGFVKICRDLTERKKFEDALRQHTRDLAEAGRRKDEFLAMLSHELRNPLAPIRTAVEVLNMRGNEPAVLAWAKEVMERQVRHMTRLVDDLLDVTRLARGKLALQRERLDFVSLVRSVLDAHTMEFHSGGWKLNFEVLNQPIWVMVDSTRLSQVVENLLENAKKFTDPGGDINVRVRENRDAGSAELSIRDTGIGIAPELLPRVFDLFEQADQSLARSRGGLGVGLALVKKLIEMHGGEVRAASAGPGQGAEFVFWIPLAQAPTGNPELPPIPAVGQALKILIIEDNRDAGDTLQMLLKGLGHQVAIARTGLAGLEEARRIQPNVVLCDLGLPGIDGYEVARELRKESGVGHARLIAISGYGTEADQRRARDSGFDLHLTKPVDPKRLLQVLAGDQ